MRIWASSLILAASVSGLLATSVGETAAAKSAPVSAVDILLNDVRFKTIFSSMDETPTSECPSFVTLTNAPNNYSFKKAGDRLVDLNTRIDTLDGNGTFSHASNRMYIRPGLAANQPHVLNKIWSVKHGYRSVTFKQLETGGILVANYSARMIGWKKIARTDQRVTFDANKNTLKYHFSSTGKPDIDCSYEK